MTLMRNGEIHLADVVDPGVDRVLSVPVSHPGQAWPFRGQFRLLPSYDRDPSLAAVAEDGELLHFPLPSWLPVDGDRRHPLESVATEIPNSG
jgi:hypothetical protein